ncbi:MAG: hypothetical protein HYX51_00395 [Chloroflexi bacterium]|nr:hypothetical protein [Chloroflexota bacterium]
MAVHPHQQRPPLRPARRRQFRLKDGKILEERVYMDTALLRAARTGAVPEPLLSL